MGFGTSFLRNHTGANGALATEQSENFGGTKLDIDGGLRVRSEYFTMKNLDTTGFGIIFGFDGTNYNTLAYGENFSQPIIADRYYFRSDTTNAIVPFQIIVSLKSKR